VPTRSSRHSSRGSISRRQGSRSISSTSSSDGRHQPAGITDAVRRKRKRSPLRPASWRCAQLHRVPAPCCEAGGNWAAPCCERCVGLQTSCLRQRRRRCTREHGY
jgi:hypothetical protein